MERLVELLRELCRIFRSRYVRELESEVNRLRAENYALLNSLLGAAGVPPLRIPAPLQYASRAPQIRAARFHPALQQLDDAQLEEPAPADSAIPPVRRRSWQQIGRMLEIEEARREREHAVKIAQVRLRPEAAAPEAAAHTNGSARPIASL